METVEDTIRREVAAVFQSLNSDKAPSKAALEALGALASRFFIDLNRMADAAERTAVAMEKLNERLETDIANVLYPPDEDDVDDDDLVDTKEH